MSRAMRHGLRRLLFSRRTRLAGVLLVGALAGGLLLALIAAGEIYDYIDSVDGVHLPEVEAIVCLAGGRGRIAAAGDVWYRYWEQARAGHRRPPRLYISGMGRTSTWSTLERQVRRGVLDVLRPEDVILETESTNTEENARVLARYARQNGWTHVLLMTSRYHMKRAKFIFDGVFLAQERPLRIETLSVYQEPFEPGEWRRSFHGTEVTLTEYVKWLGYKTVWVP